MVRSSKHRKTLLLLDLTCGSARRCCFEGLFLLLTYGTHIRRTVAEHQRPARRQPQHSRISRLPKLYLHRCWSCTSLCCACTTPPTYTSHTCWLQLISCRATSLSTAALHAEDGLSGCRESTDHALRLQVAPQAVAAAAGVQQDPPHAAQQVTVTIVVNVCSLLDAPPQDVAAAHSFRLSQPSVWYQFTTCKLNLQV